jgi:putative nucleotidyltransferase with HDIG domain
MLKKISVSSLRQGMFLQALDGSWLDHPFWKRSFLLCDDDIKKIVASGIGSVVVDTDKGLDIDTQISVTGHLFGEPDLAPEQPGDSLPAAPDPTQERQPRKSVADEIEHAKRLFVSASAQMKLIFQQTRMGKAVSTTVMMPLVEAISASVIRNPHALTSVARLKRHDGYTYMHSVAVCALMTALACELEFDEQAIREAGAAGLMHDIGKTMMRLNVLNKRGKLTAEEFEIAKMHPEDGWRLLQSTDVSTGVLQVALHHHEKFDGSGYPHQLKGEAIPLLARMGAVCDVYDAVTSERPYKAAWQPAEALRSMASWDAHFDKSILARFVKCIGIYPVGTLVRLESGHLAVVLDQNRGVISAPVVKKFFSTKSNQPVIPQVLNLEKAQGSDRIVRVEDPQVWNFPHLTELWLNHIAL